MAFWHPAWTARNCYADLWLKGHPSLDITKADDIGFVMGCEAHRRWVEGTPPPAGLEHFGSPEPFLLAHFGFTHAGYLSALDGWKRAFGVLRVTVDSNIIIGMDRPAQAPSYMLFRQLHHAGQISVAVSARFVQDKWADQDRGRVWRHHQAFRFFDLLPSCARAGESLPGYDVPTNRDLMTKIERVLRVDPKAKNPNQRRDADHVYSHLISNRDYFLTHEKRLLQWSADLLTQLEIVAMAPDTLLTAFSKARNDLPPCAPVDAAAISSRL